MSAVPAPGYWILTATSRPSRQRRPVHLADARGGGRLVVEVGERAAARCRRAAAASTAWTVRTGIGGASSCSLTSASR